MKILYIPFVLDDSLFDLNIKAENWKTYYQEKNEEVVIVFHEGLTTTTAAMIKNELEAGNCKIYILGHGLSTKDRTIANQVEVDEFFRTLTIKKVAQRFKTDLMKEIAFSNKNRVKLFFCDEADDDKKPKKMAKAFRHYLGEVYQELDVQYYSEIGIGIPTHSFSPNAIEKITNKKAVRHIIKTNDFYSLNLSCIVGEVKSFKHGLNKGNLPNFFAPWQPDKQIEYPEFSHPIIKQLAMYLVKLIQRDKILSTLQQKIIPSLLSSLPTQITDYLANEVTIVNEYFKIEIKINPEFLEKLSEKLNASDEKRAINAI